MIASVSSFQMHGKDVNGHVVFVVKSGLEVWSKIQ